jgi:hypothetical protein
MLKNFDSLETWDLFEIAKWPRIDNDGIKFVECDYNYIAKRLESSIWLRDLERCKVFGGKVHICDLKGETIYGNQSNLFASCEDQIVQNKIGKEIGCFFWEVELNYNELVRIDDENYVALVKNKAKINFNCNGIQKESSPITNHYHIKASRDCFVSMENLDAKIAREYPNTNIRHLTFGNGRISEDHFIHSMVTFKSFEFKPLDTSEIEASLKELSEAKKKYTRREKYDRYNNGFFPTMA